MIVDYFVIRRGNMSLADMFTTSSTGRYFYWNGVNIRAYAAFIIGFILPLPGFVASFGYSISDAAAHMYALGWILSFLMGSLAYFVVCKVWKVPGDDWRCRWEETMPMDIVAVIDSIQVGDGAEGSGLHGSWEKTHKVNASPV